MRITFVIPVFNECETLDALVKGISEQVEAYEHRILIVDDGSTDGSFEVLCALQCRYDTVDIIRLRRNFGKSTALAMGFARADGDLVVTMDADLQDDPAEIPRFLEKIEEGFDVVCGWKKVRHDPWHKTVPSRVYNGAVAWLFGLPLHDVNCGFKAFRTEVIKNIRLYGELHRLIPALASNLGYRIGEIPVTHRPRRFGRSKYGVERFARGAVDVLSVWFLGRYRESPGHFFGNLGAVGVGLGLLGLLVAGLGWGFAGRGYAVGLFAGGLLLGGMLAFGLGLLAELVVYQRPPTDAGCHVAEERFGGIPGD